MLACMNSSYRHLQLYLRGEKIMWVYIVVVIVVVLLLIVLFLSNKGKNPNKDSSLSMSEKEELQEDYLSHGSYDREDDNKNI